VAKGNVVILEEGVHLPDEGEGIGDDRAGGS